MSHSIEKLIVNSAFEKPKYHWVFSPEKDQFILADGRRPAGYFVAEQGSNQYNDVGRFIELPLVNEIRARVTKWRLNGYPGITGVTKKLLAHWQDNNQRTYPFFFCQLDAIETLIWLTEASDSEKVGISIDQESNEFTRICSKMATGTGKTVVMAMLIAWQVINKVSYPQDKRFTKYVFIVTPGITVKERLKVLNPTTENNYYDQFGIVPVSFKDKFSQGIIEIKNWQSLQWDDEQTIRKKHSVDKRGPLSDEAYSRKMLGAISKSSNILVINDEAHHAWKHNPEIKIKIDKDDKDRIKDLEESSTVWVGGLEKINRARKIHTCYDFSATPFAPSGKKNDETALFSWIVSDFGLNDAIESGLVKTPRMVVRDDGIPNAQSYKSKLYHIYGETEVKQDLSRPAKEQESLPDLVLNAYYLLGKDWLNTYESWKKTGCHIPPVMITVANRTETASRIKYSFIKNLINIPELCEPEYVLQIDSKILKAAESNESNSKSDRESELREIVNTVGIEGKPGEQIRNIISVSMLSEGWDTKTVTHIMGLRAFSSQLLCEQTIGRGLRRTSYDVDPQSGLFTSEYVNIFGVPFNYLPQESGTTGNAPAIPKTQIYVRKDKAQFEIHWPNVIRFDKQIRDVLTLDLKNISELQINATEEITLAELAPFIGDKEYLNELGRIDLRDLNENDFRLQTLVFKVASTLYEEDWSNKGTRVGLIGQLIRLIEQFIDSDKIKIVPKGYSERGSSKRRIVLYQHIGRITAHIRKHIIVENTENLSIVLDSNRPIMSTADMMTWYTSKPCKLTEKSQISHCVFDSSLESSHATKLDLNPKVAAWAKNDHLNFEIGYIFNGGFANYRPDFLIRLTNNHYLILETKGIKSERSEEKRKALKDWVSAVNNAKQYGTWHSDICYSDEDFDSIIDKYVGYENE